MGEPAEARRQAEASLALYRELDDPSGGAETLTNLGVLAHEAKEYPAARRLYLESLELHRRLGDRQGIAVTLNNLGELALDAGDAEAGFPFFVHAGRLLGELHSGLVQVPEHF